MNLSDIPTNKRVALISGSLACFAVIALCATDINEATGLLMGLMFIILYNIWSQARELMQIERHKQRRASDADAVVADMSQKGFIVLNRSKTQIQFCRKKSFSFILALLGLLFFGVGLLIYIIYYVSQKDEVVTLTFTAKSG